MRPATLRTMHLPVVLFFCVFLSFTPGHCGTEATKDDQRARLPEFLSELDLASLEASEEDVEALKKVVKRLAPEKNGVTGQPGVDFPALTTIPVTSFSCRGLKGGYYADLETNCQVFHICDNGRKISFLCPNGTIFQQSQLICDWWFKVDCSKSAELYEQSAEQLAEEERKRADAKRMNSEFHRNSEKEQDFGQPQNVDYDGRQNGRMNPYGQSAKQNQIQDNQQNVKSTEQFGQGNVFNQASRNQYQQNGNSAFDNSGKRGPSNDQFYQQQQQGVFPNNYQTGNRQQNQLVNDQSGKSDEYNANHNQRGANKFQRDRSNYQDVSDRSQDYYGSAANQNAARREKPRNVKSGNLNRNSVNNLAENNEKVTPSYTETTTFRTTTGSPIKEFQQLAESAAFVSNRGNHYSNKAYNSQQYHYQSYTNRVTNSENNDRQSTSSPVKNKNEPGTVRTRFSIPPFPGPTFAPIYKPRTTTTTTPASYETTLQPVTTERPAYNTDYHNRQNYQSETTYTPYSTNQDYQTTTESYYSSNNADYYADNFGTTSTYDEQGRTTQRNEESYHRNTGNSGNYNENSVTAEQTTQPYDANYYGQTSGYKDNTATSRDVSQDTSAFPTTRSFSNTENRQNVGTGKAVTEASAENYHGRGDVRSSTDYLSNVNGNSWNNEQRFSTRSPSRTSQISRENSISASTDKPSRSTQSYQQTTYQQNSLGTGKTLSPYDTSFTYKQGKVMSTLGPYVPFTKNYVYPTSSTTTTQKPPVYTATVPTYSSTVGNYRVTAKNLIAKIRSSTSSPGKAKTAATYLPESSTKRLSALENRPETEREHVLSMLQSLKGLQNNVAGLNGNGSGINVPTSSGPSTLHSLALYFATANDSFDPKEAKDSAVSIQYQPATPDVLAPRTDNSSVELPTSILTQHTISSYTELFNLNNALEGNATAVDLFNSDEDAEENEPSGDLDIEQSEGPVNGAKKSNGTKLRELAQVFTHALSAYLQDPDTFKKVLTEIRPTEPSLSTTDDQFDITTQYPTTVDEYPSVTKEKDEVLDFSDDTNGPVRRKPTTSYSTTVQSPATTESTHRAYYTTSNEYYTTPYVQDNRYESTTPAPNDPKNDGQSTYFGTTTTPSSNTFAFAVNSAFGQGNGNALNNYDNRQNEPSGPSGPSGPDDSSQTYDNYFPSGYSENRIAGFQNNTANTFAPYGKYVKPSDATPINDNYVASSTPASYNENQETIVYGSDRYSVSRQPDFELTPPLFQNYGDTGNSVPSGFRESERTTNFVSRPETVATTPVPKEIYTGSSTSQPFRIRYYDSYTTNLPSRKSSQESLATARSTYSNFRANYDVNGQSRTTEKPLTTTASSSRNLDPVTTVINNVNDISRHQNTVTRGVNNDRNKLTSSTAQKTDILGADHWTTSPEVTQLWESTVFIDPKRINQGLESDQRVTQSPIPDFTGTERIVRSTTPSSGFEGFTDSSNEVTQAQNDRDDLSTPWQWAPSNNDSPTAFTLLPTSFNTENTATPTPIYTTSSSITTTITSSVTSTSAAPQDSLVTSLSPFKQSSLVYNTTENEIAKAQEMFGKLNVSSTHTLMKVMQQADKNATVRQLILLLISHCNGPMNKTMEEEKEELLNALLRMPVNEFTSEESREIVAGINKLNLPTSRSRSVSNLNPRARSTSTTTTSTTTTAPRPSVTTFRSRKGRKYRTSTGNPLTLSRRSDEAKIEESDDSAAANDTTAADSRALELLRSLYTIAAKWG